MAHIGADSGKPVIRYGALQFLHAFFIGSDLRLDVGHIHIRAARGITRARQQRAYATQLARFLDARQAVAGPIAISADPRRVTVRLVREGVSARHEGEGEVLVHAVVLAGGAIAGFVETCARSASAPAAAEEVDTAFAPAGTGSLLQARVAAVLRSAPGVPVFVKGDREVPYGRVVEAMVLLQSAGARKVGFLTDPVTVRGAR